MWQKSYDDSPTLYLISTPIGNMEDMTLRGIRILKEVEVIFSEDTRVTGMLLNYFNIKKKLLSLHNFNEDKVKFDVLKYLSSGYSVGLVTDRGTPIISDPGYKTVKYVSDRGYNVVALPGANAFVPALIVSGISPKYFMFYGFLDSKKGKKRRELEEIKEYKNTIIFYESPHRIVETLELMLEVFGNRYISISREISKKFESVYRGYIKDIFNDFDMIKGEFVIVVEGYCEKGEVISEADIISLVNKYVGDGLKVMDAIKKVAKDKEMKKGDVYSIYHKGGVED